MLNGAPADLAGLALLALGALLLVTLVRQHLLLPVRRLRLVIESRASGDRLARAAPTGRGPLAALGRALDDLLDRLDGSPSGGDEARQLLDAAPGGAGLGLWSLDLVTGRLQVDELWLALSGQPPGTLIVDETGEQALVHPDDLPRLRAARAAHLDDPDGAYECEFRVPGLDGGWRWVMDRARVVLTGDDGEPARLAGSREDIDERKCAQLAMAASERLLSTVLDNMPMPVFLKDRDGRFLLANDCYLRCYDVRPQDLLQHTAAQAHVAPFGEQYMRQDAEVIAARQALRWESSERVADGSIRSFSVTKFPVFDDNDELIAVGGITIDDTDRLRSMAAIRASEERLRSLTAHLPGAVYRALAEPGEAEPRWRVVYVSERADSMLGPSHSEPCGDSRGFHALLHEDDRERVLSTLARSAALEADFDIEYRLRVTPEDVRWVNDRGRCVRDAETGSLYVDGLLLDVTARKQAEFELTRQRTLFEAIFNSVPDALYITDESHAVKLVNPGFERVLGYSSADLLGRSTRVLYPDEDTWQEQARRHCDARACAPARPTTLAHRRRDGSTFAGETVASPILDAGGSVLGFVGIVRDVDGRLRAERELLEARDRALDAARAKTDFLANMSHELRTPMNGVLGMLELLQQTPLNAEQAECVEVACRCGASLLKLIDDVLEFSDLDAGHPRPECVEFDPRDCVDEVVGLLAEHARQKRVELLACFAPSLPRRTRGDPRRLRQVLLNLVGNAVKFTSDGEVVVSAGFAAAAGDRAPRLLFEVRDSGIGITPEMQQHIFKPFVQGDSSSTRRFGGTGLGLAICRRLVEVLGGGIGVESVPGEGSRFFFDTPVVGVAAPAGANPPATAPPGQPMPPAGEHGEPLTSVPVESDGPSFDASGARVLVAEDVEVNERVVSAMLARLGVRAQRVSDGAAALRVLGEDRVDLCLMDCQMPEMDGLEATRRRRAIEQSTGATRTPIIALTASAGAGDRERCLAAGMDDYLVKPLTLQALHACLLRWLPAATGERTAPSPVAAVGAESPVDAKVMDDMHEMLGAETVREVVAAFLRGAEGFVDELRDCVQRGDAAGATARLHRMVGSAAALGANRLAEVCRGYEKRLRASATLVSIDLDGLEDLLQRTCEALRQRVAEQLPAAG